MSKCHFVGNLMSRLACFECSFTTFDKHVINEQLANFHAIINFTDPI